MADSYRRAHFDPLSLGGVLDRATGTVAFTAAGGTGPGATYVYDDDIVLAVNVALAVDRPLLVSGEPGSGKSTLARNVAAMLGWRYYQRVITSRTQARDLLWSFDAVRRLGDAQAGAQDGKRELLPKPFYVQPEALWWAFDPESAAVRGVRQDDLSSEMWAHPALAVADPGTEGDPERAVVLLDEIDKADPDVPNDMLEPLDAGTFRVQETELPVSRRSKKVLLVITTNGERELPPAFLRRCVSLHLPAPRKDWLTRIGRERFPTMDEALVGKLADEVMRLRKEARSRKLREPSTAEYLDALSACASLGITTASPEWERTRRAVLLKHPPDPASGEKEETGREEPAA